MWSTVVAIFFIRYLFPKYLLSHHFWTAEQKKSFDQSFLQKRLKYFESVSAEDVVKASASMQLVKEQVGVCVNCTCFLLVIVVDNYYNHECLSDYISTSK